MLINEVCCIMKDYRALISKQRSAVMGLMALLIIVYHARWETTSWIFNNTVNRYGSIGVDVFFLFQDLAWRMR